MKRLHRADISGCTTAQRGWILSCALTAPSPFARRPSMSTPPQTCSAQWRVPPSNCKQNRSSEGCALSAGLYKEFVLRHGGVWAALIEFVKTHAKACVDQGAPLRVIVTAEERKRNAEQNRYYWSAVLQHIAEHAEVGGKRYDKEVWHEFF